MQIMKEKFNKDTEILKKHQVEIWEIKSSIFQVKTSIKSFANRVEKVENKVSGIKDKEEELDQ
jgi:predicted  nucleic acid-binding Zn-ribbon protein